MRRRRVLCGLFCDHAQHCHRFVFPPKQQVIQPQTNTTFNVIFVPRQRGRVGCRLQVHTTFGMRPYEMRGHGTACPYRLQPLVGIRAPLNATVRLDVFMYNPNATPLQIMEVYSSGGDFQLELPVGGTDAPRNAWQIPPFSERALVRVHFRAQRVGLQMAFVRIIVSIAERAFAN